MKIVAIVQARMGSTRLPGKVMLPILDKSILWHIVNRLKSCNELNEICIATSTNSADDIIEQFATKEKIILHRGPEEDVLDRIIGASTKLHADAIIRITADCPLVDPSLIDKIIKLFKSKPHLEYVSNIIDRTFPDGLDVELFSNKLLQKLSNEKAENRLNFVRFVIDNHEKYQTENISNNRNLSKLRWTLDYPEDYEFIQRIYAELFDKDIVFGFESIIELLSRKPDLTLINNMYPTDM